MSPDRCAERIEGAKIALNLCRYRNLQLKGPSMKKFAISLFVATSSAFALTAFAHGGHGVTPPTSLLHYLVEPLHVLPELAAIGLVAVAAWLLHRKRSRNK